MPRKDSKLVSGHYDDWLEEGSGDAFGDAYEVTLAGEDFDHWCAGELREIGLRAVAEATEGLRITAD